jgi:hypothetical protein
VIVDREGMTAPFLRDLKALGHTVVTILRTDPYDGLQSFTEVGMFVPLERDQQGNLVPEVAPACFALPLPDQKGQVLPVRVALIRDLRRRVACTQQEEETDEDVRKPAWWQAEWKAEPTPAAPTEARLIPIVTTADTIDAVELAQTSTRRWEVARKYPSRLSCAAWPGYESRLWQGAHCQLRGRQKAGCLRETREQSPALDRFCSTPLPQSLSSL